MMNGHLHGSEAHKSEQASRESRTSAKQSHWFSVPPIIRHVFDSVPLLTIANNPRPQRSTRSRQQHVLYIFASNDQIVRSNLSCNPACLKWQAYLISRDIQFTVKTSNNHASTSGSLPFLLPKRTSVGTQPAPIASSKLQKWCSTQSDVADIIGEGEDIYQALIDQNLRAAWLYHLYLDTSNFDAVATPLYIRTSSSNFLVQTIIASQLRAAARSELTKSWPIIDRNAIFDAADKAFKSLSTLLGQRKFFAGDSKPGLFDASLFAYTHLLCETNLGWADMTLQDILMQYPNLIEHRDRVLHICLKS